MKSQEHHCKYWGGKKAWGLHICRASNIFAFPLSTVTAVSLTLLRWHVGHGSHMGLRRAWKNRDAQLIRTKTKTDSVLFAGYSSSTIEDRTIGLFSPILWWGFPGFREHLYCLKSRCTLIQIMGNFKMIQVRLLHYVMVNMRFIFI